MGRRLERKARKLEKKIQKRLPRCRKFVAKLWDTPAKTLDKYRIDVSRSPPPMEDLAGMSCDGCGSITLYPRPLLDVSPTLVHELTHSNLRHLFPLNGESLSADSVSEGLADLSDHLYRKQEYSLGRNILENQYTLIFQTLERIRELFQGPDTAPPRAMRVSQYSIGIPFIRALANCDLSPKKILKLVTTAPPSIDDLFRPAEYLSRNGIQMPDLFTGHNSNQVQTDGPRYVLPVTSKLDRWVKEALDQGLKWAEEGDGLKYWPSWHTSVLRAGLVLLGYPFRAMQLFFRVIKRHIRPLNQSIVYPAEFEPPDPSMGGVIFVDSVMHNLGEEWKTALKQHPPNSMTHIMDPDTYIAEVREKLNLTENPIPGPDQSRPCSYCRTP